MRSTIIALRRETAPLGPREDPIIGCRILTEPFFWPRDLWIPVPESFSPNIVVGKGYSANTEESVRLWNAVSERLAATPRPDERRVGTERASTGRPRGAQTS